MTAAQSSIEALRIAARAAEEKQGTNLFAVDASDAMGDLKLVRREGRSSGRWILLDFGDIVVHVQHEEDREFYALDRLWAEAPRIELGVENEAPFDIEGETEEDAARIIPAQDEA